MILYAFLQEVPAPLAATVQEREQVTRSRVLAEDDDTDLGVRLAKPGRRLDPLVRVSRRHADVRHDDVGAFCSDGDEQRVEVAAHRNDLEPLLRLEHTPEPLADEVLVFGENDSDRHCLRIRR